MFFCSKVFVHIFLGQWIKILIFFLNLFRTDWRFDFRYRHAQSRRIALVARKTRIRGKRFPSPLWIHSSSSPSFFFYCRFLTRQFFILNRLAFFLPNVWR